MKLSKRLTCIADMVPNNSNVIDVGCDHGLLSIFLDKEKSCSALACDINEKALNSAKINKSKYDSNIILKQTDGINGIEINDNDYIIIAGMGTSTIKHILDNKKLSNNIIISSNNQIHELRKYVCELGFKIEDEKFISENQKKYVIIKFKKGKKKYSSIDLKYGPILRYNMEYLIFELEKLFQIKEKIVNSNFIVKYHNKKEIKKVEKLIEKIKENN